MVFRAGFISAGALAIAFAVAGAANAETVQHHPKHGKAATRRTPAGRDITVHNQTPSWLTLGPDARSRAGTSYATETFDQPSPVQGTFTGYRGREQLIDRFGGGGATLFSF